MKRSLAVENCDNFELIKKKSTGDKRTGSIYTITNGKRIVLPYRYEFKCHAKRRWLNRTIINVFSSEFQMDNEAYYRQAIEEGRITVNGNRIAEKYLIKDNDVIIHEKQMIEPEVSGTSIEIIEETSDIIVVNKPSSIPVHSAGRFHYNTLVNILKYEMGFTELYPIHRLDRLTSGVLLIARTREVCRKYSDLFMMEGKIKKTYLALVKGNPMNWHNHTMEVNEPISTVHYKLALNAVDKSDRGKQAKTIFRKLCSVNDETSLIQCEPVTGRTHQIRVHLRWLGLPILNDPLYNNEKIWNVFDGDDVLNAEDLRERADLYLNNYNYTSECSKQMELYLHAWKLLIKDNGMEYVSDYPDWVKRTEYHVMD